MLWLACVTIRLIARLVRIRAGQQIFPQLRTERYKSRPKRWTLLPTGGGAGNGRLPCAIIIAKRESVIEYGLFPEPYRLPVGGPIAPRLPHSRKLSNNVLKFEIHGRVLTGLNPCVSAGESLDGQNHAGTRRSDASRTR